MAESGCEEEELVRDSAHNGDSQHRPAPGHYVALFSVPLLWGTFTPSLKLLLDHRRAPPVILTNLMSHLVGTSALAVLWAFEARWRRVCIPVDDSVTDARTAHRRAMLACSELGIYLFFGQLLQLVGLMGTSAMTNAILVQSSVVFVPLIEAQHADWRGAPLKQLHHLLPSLLALAGIAMITVVPGLLNAATDTAAAEGEQTAVGVVCSLAAALSYAMHTVRLSEYGEVDATVQATGQVASNALLDLLALLCGMVFGVGASSRRWLRRANDAALQRLALTATWNGVMIVGATTWAMSYAQRRIRASTATLAYAMEPLFACVFAAIVLQESIGLTQMGGGALVVAANVIAGLQLANE